MRPVVIAFVLFAIACAAFVAVYIHNDHYVKHQIHSAKTARCINGEVILDGTRKAVDIMNVPLTCYHVYSEGEQVHAKP